MGAEELRSPWAASVPARHPLRPARPRPERARPTSDGAGNGRERVQRAIRRYYETGDRSAREVVVVAYQGLAYSLASRFVQRGEELDDLNQVAMIGLLKAVDRFDPDRGAELTTFATATILGELKRHLRDREIGRASC